MLLVFSTGSLRRVFFLFYGLTEFLCIRSSGLKVWVSSCPRYFYICPRWFSAVLFNMSYHFNYCFANPGFGAFTRSFGARFAPSVSRRPLFQKLIFFTPISAAEKRGYFHFRILANHLAFFLPFPGHWVQTSVWLSHWPTFFTFSDRPWGIDLYYYFSF